VIFLNTAQADSYDLSFSSFFFLRSCAARGSECSREVRIPRSFLGAIRDRAFSRWKIPNTTSSPTAIFESSRRGTRTRNSVRPVVDEADGRERERVKRREGKKKEEKEGERESTSLGGSVISRGRIARVLVCVICVVDDRVSRDFAQAELYSWGSQPRISDQSPPSRDSTALHGTYPRSSRRHLSSLGSSTRMGGRYVGRPVGVSSTPSWRLVREGAQFAFAEDSRRSPERRLHDGCSNFGRSSLRSASSFVM